MKPVIFGVIAFVIGLGGSTGTLVLLAPMPKPLTAAEAAAHADSLAHKAAPAPVMVASGPAHVPVPVMPVPDTAHAVAPAQQAAPANTAVAASTENSAAPAVSKVVPAAPAKPGAPDADSYKQVGNILMNMKPAEAAKIVGYLNDEQVEGLLRSLSPRQAAVVLGQLPPERAAALSRRLLVPVHEAGR